MAEMIKSNGEGFLASHCSTPSEDGLSFISRFLFVICANADVSRSCHHLPGIIMGSCIQLLGCFPGLCLMVGD